MDGAHAEGVGVPGIKAHTRSLVLEAAANANPRAVADYATAALLSMGVSGSDGVSLDALLDALTPALACNRYRYYTQTNFALYPNLGAFLHKSLSPILQ